MRHPLCVRVLSLSLLIGLFTALTAASNGPRRDVNWPSFRGANAGGIAEGFETPITWGVAEGRNVRWKTPIPGLGNSSPIVWGNRLFLTTAISGQPKPGLKPGLYGDVASVQDDTSHTWKVFCLDKSSGRILWERTARTGVPKTRRHPKSTQANPTMATDGKRLVAFFGPEGLYCYDLSGKLLWKKDLGALDAAWFVDPTAQWGFSSSPVIYQDLVLVQCDVLRHPFLAAFRLADGSEVWRTVRDDVPTYSTPVLATDGGQTQLIVNGFHHIGGYDAKTGKELWRLKGGGDIPVPAPVVGHGLVFITNAHGRMAPIYAIRTTARGDISLAEAATSNAHVAWSYARDGSYMQTPLVYGDYLYVCRWNGIWSCYEAKTGKRLYEERLGTGRTAFTASPVAAEGKIYVPSEEGDVYVIAAGPRYRLLGVNPLGEICMATPAISAGTLFFRTQGHLLAIAAPAKQ